MDFVTARGGGGKRIRLGIVGQEAGAEARHGRETLGNGDGAGETGILGQTPPMAQ